MIETGKIAEDIAAKCLEKKGYKIIGRNYRRPWGEIDIIGKDKNGLIVFFEVKAMKSSGTGLVPEDNLTKAKRDKLRKICEQCYLTNQKLFDEKKGWRMDLIAIDIPDDEELTKTFKCDNIRYYENI